MVPVLRAHKLTRKSSSDDLINPGDFYTVQRLGSTNENIRPHPAIIMKCPFCNCDMASTGRHTITDPTRIRWRKILSRIGFPQHVTVSPMLQCPYNSSHKFEIRKGKITQTL